MAQSLSQEIYGEISHILGFKPSISIVEQLWCPLGISISKGIEKNHKPYFQGILGVQGSGKSTLTKALQVILTYLGHSSICISLDDFYKTYQERELLLVEDPRLIWRGPPGTHDISLAKTVFEQLRNPESSLIAIPRFDKSAYNGAGDRTTPELITPVDVVLLEGWFVGVHPIPPEVFNQPLYPHPFQSPEDIQFAIDCNERLKDYLPLWEMLDHLLVLRPQDYRDSKKWRQEAEEKMIAHRGSGMTSQEVEVFVEYFWKALHPQLFMSSVGNIPVSWVQIKGDRSLVNVSHPLK